jgi:hypothetical protein
MDEGPADCSAWYAEGRYSISAKGRSELCAITGPTKDTWSFIEQGQFKFDH